MNKKDIINNKGFTLIELLIVIAIIAILTALLLANFIGVRQRARDAQRKSDLKQMQTALELYRADNGTYPTYIINNMPYSLSSGQLLPYIDSSNHLNIIPKYMSMIPVDPLYGATCKGYIHRTDSNGYTIFANLENTNDQDATKYKPMPNLTCGGTCWDANGNKSSTGPCVTFKFDTNVCDCNGGQTVNYWVNNP